MKTHTAKTNFLVSEYKRLHHKIASGNATQDEQNKCQAIEHELKQREQIKLLQNGVVKRKRGI